MNVEQVLCISFTFGYVYTKIRREPTRCGLNSLQVRSPIDVDWNFHFRPTAMPLPRLMAWFPNGVERAIEVPILSAIPPGGA